jgi:hypothetical protein
MTINACQYLSTRTHDQVPSLSRDGACPEPRASTELGTFAEFAKDVPSRGASRVVEGDHDSDSSRSENRLVHGTCPVFKLFLSTGRSNQSVLASRRPNTIAA